MQFNHLDRPLYQILYHSWNGLKRIVHSQIKSRVWTIAKGSTNGTVEIQIMHYAFSIMHVEVLNGDNNQYALWLKFV